jgi:two-component system KDP operon response regulator KdpE
MSRVLIVDDEPDIRQMLRLILQLDGHEITEAADGREAIERASDMPDIIILDIRLPDIDGLEVLRLLKGNAALAHIPVICVSAHSSPATQQEARELSAVAYVSKPFDFAHLRAVTAAAAARGAAPGTAC